MLVDVRSAVHTLVSDRVAAGIVPGSVYAVFTADGIAFDGSAGIAAVDGSSPSIDTAFRIASCTKSFTAAAVLQLRDAGLLTLDDPITKFMDIGTWELPGSEAPPPPTVGGLLSMSAGLAGDNPWADRQEAMLEGEFTALCRRGFTLSAAPGTRYEYSNLGYALLGRIIQQVSGVGYRDFVADTLLLPLRLSHATFDASTCTAPDGIAEGFHRVGDRWQRSAISSPGAFSPIGGLLMTAKDLAAWCIWLAAGYRMGAAGDDILAAGTRREMQQIHQLDPARMHGAVRAAGYGYGLEVELYDCGIVISHRGGYPGFSAQMAWHPERELGVVILENASYAQSPAITALRQVMAIETAPKRTTLWPNTVQARDDIERLLACWDDALADGLFADNLDLDLPREQRCAQLTSAAAGIGFGDACRGRPLAECEPVSTSPANVEWTVRGHRGELRCGVTLTSTRPPKVQSITLSPKGFR